MKRILLILLLGVFGAAFAGERGLTWQECVQRSANSNPEIIKAQSELISINGQLMQIRSFIIPKLSVEGSTFPGNITGQIQQTIFDRGIPPGFRVIRLGESAARANIELQYTEILFKTREAFLAALNAQEVYRLRRDYAEDFKKSTRSIKDLFEAGRIKKSDVARVEVRATLAESSADAARVEYEKQKMILDRLTGTPAAPQEEIDERFDNTMPPLEDLNVLVEKAYRHRRDLWLAEHLKLIERERIYIAAAGNVPSIVLFGKNVTEPGNLRAGVRFSSDGKDEIAGAGRNLDPTEGRNYFSAGLTVSWRIFDGFETSGKIEVAEKNVVNRENLLQHVKKVIPSQVAFAHETVKLTHRMYQTATAVNPDQTLELAQMDFDSGKATQLDILDTKEIVLRQKEGMISALANLALAKAALDRATGQGVEWISEKVSISGANK